MSANPITTTTEPPAMSDQPISTQPQPSGNQPANPSRPAPRTRDQGPVIVKKYANRRLYNTDSSTYVTLENLAEMVRDQIEFLVVDAKTGDDLTRPTLTQIIVEQEAKADSTGATGGMNLLPVTFLRQLIGLYGGSMQTFVPNYLDQMMRHFTESQQQWQDLVTKSLGSTLNTTLNTTAAPSVTSPIQALQQAGQQGFQRAFDQNRAMLQQAQAQAQHMQQAMLKFFMPFASAPNATPSDKADTLTAMKQKVASLEEELKGMEGDS